jgi:hypothetical protein
MFSSPVEMVGAVEDAQAEAKRQIEMFDRVIGFLD